MKKKFWLLAAAVIPLAVVLFLSGCVTNRVSAKVTGPVPLGTEPVDTAVLASLPVKSNETTPLEGIWQVVSTTSAGTAQIEYTFSGNTVALTITQKGALSMAQRGVFKLTGNTAEIYWLESWNAAKSVWGISPTGIVTIAGTKMIETLNWALNNDQLIINNQADPPFSRINAASYTIPATGAREVVANNGLSLGENDAVLTVRRITETGMKTRIGEPEEWEIYIDGSQAGIVGKHETKALVVPNGVHTIYIAFNRDVGDIARKSYEWTFYAWSNHIPLATYLEGAGGQNLVLALD
jgi:hypothetical protein